MTIVGVNIKQVTAGNVIRNVINDVQAVATQNDNQFIKIMGMNRKNGLRYWKLIMWQP